MLIAVAWALCWDKPKNKTKAGTAIVPPPDPKRPFTNPIINPISKNLTLFFTILMKSPRIFFLVSVILYINNTFPKKDVTYSLDKNLNRKYTWIHIGILGIKEVKYESCR